MRARRLLTAAGYQAAAIATIFDAGYVVQYATSDWRGPGNDFIAFLLGARVGLAAGWSHLYDLGVQRAVLHHVWPGAQLTPIFQFISPPPMAWLNVAFAPLPVPVAAALWAILNVAALVFAWSLLAPGRGRHRGAQLVVAAGFFPVAYGLRLGQPVPLMVAAMAASWWLLQRQRPWLAGLALTVLVLKPQIALIVPLALLAAGYWRTAAGAAGAAAVLAVLSVLVIGPHGVDSYLRLTEHRQAQPLDWIETVASITGPGLPAHIAQAAVGVLAIALAATTARGNVSRALSIGVLGSILAAPYLHLDDQALLLVPAWLTWRAELPLHVKVWAALALIAVELGPLVGAPLGLAALTVWLVLTAAPSLPVSRTLPTRGDQHLTERSSDRC